MGAAGDAGVIEGAPDAPAVGAGAKVVEHPAQIGLGGAAVALDEQQRVAAPQIGAERDHLAPRIDREQRSDDVVGAIGTLQRHRGMDVAGNPLRVARQDLADFLLEHRDRRPAVDPQHPRSLAGADLVDRADRRAALREAGDQRHLGAEQDARDPALGRPAGDLQRRPGGRGQPADQEGVHGLAQPADRLGRAAMAGVAVDHAEAAAAVDGPAGKPGVEVVAPVAQAVEQPEAALGHARDQGHDRAAARVFPTAAADAGAARADPRADPGRLGQAGDDQVERLGQRVAGVDEAEIGARRQIGQALDAGPAGAVPVAVAPLGRPENVHPLPPNRPFT